MKIVDRFGSRPGAELVRLPQGGERLLAVEHAAALLVNEQTAFRVVCTPELLPQLALGRLLTEGWIASADEVEQVAVCAEGLKVSVHLTHPLAAAPAAGQEVPSCCTDNLTVASPVALRPLAPVPQLEVPEAWVGMLAAAMGGELPLYRAPAPCTAVFCCGRAASCTSARIWAATMRSTKPSAAHWRTECRWGSASFTPAAGCRWIWCARPSAPVSPPSSARRCPPSSRWSWRKNTD